MGSCMTPDYPPDYIEKSNKTLDDAYDEVSLSFQDEYKNLNKNPLIKEKHNHYFRDCPYDKIDVYRIIEIFDIKDPCIQHALKKLLVAGVRGHKDISRDIQDVIDTCERWKAMRQEELDVSKGLM